MSILVINSFAAMKDSKHLQAVSGRIGDLVNQARISKRPVAHLHQKRSSRGSGLRVPIDRYDPVFQSVDLSEGFPDALFEFILASPTRTIQLVGAASRDQFERLSRLIQIAGYAVKVEPGAIVPTSE